MRCQNHWILGVSANFGQAQTYTHRLFFFCAGFLDRRISWRVEALSSMPFGIWLSRISRERNWNMNLEGSRASLHYSNIIRIWVCLKIVYPYTQWLMIIIPTQWLFHWGYTPFSDITICLNGKCHCCLYIFLPRAVCGSQGSSESSRPQAMLYWRSDASDRRDQLLITVDARNQADFGLYKQQYGDVWK